MTLEAKISSQIRPVIVDTAVFGSSTVRLPADTDGHDWVGCMDHAHNMIEESANRFLDHVENVYKTAPQGSVVSDFEDNLEAAGKRHSVPFSCLWDFRDQVDAVLSGTLTGITALDSERDLGLMVSTYGVLSEKFPFVEPKPSLIDRINIFKKAPEVPRFYQIDVFNSYVDVTETYMDEVEAGRMDISEERIGRLAGGLSKIHSFANSEALHYQEYEDLSRKVSKSSDRLEEIKAQIAGPRM